MVGLLWFGLMKPTQITWLNLYLYKFKDTIYSGTIAILA